MGGDDRAGRIIKATGGFYYVAAAEGVVECRARGLFRSKNQAPYVGDVVRFQVTGQSGYINRIEERKNWLARPPVANLDQMVLVLSVVDPYPNLLVADKLICIAEHKDIEPLIVITKPDLASSDDLERIYQKAGFTLYVVNNNTGEGSQAVKDALAGKLSAFAGNSGVGKSSLLNRIDPRLALATGETSKKLGRGKHTTRHVEIFTLDNGGLIADTPGFSSIEPGRTDVIEGEALANSFREFGDYIGKCRFSDCAHLVEKGCVILEAVEKGEIAPSRHASYKAMVQEARERRPY